VSWVLTKCDGAHGFSQNSPKSRWVERPFAFHQRDQSVAPTPNTRGPCPALSCDLLSVFFPGKAESTSTSSGVQQAGVQLLFSPPCTLSRGELVSGCDPCLQGGIQLSATHLVLGAKLWPGGGKSYCKLFLCFCWAALGRSSSSRLSTRDVWRTDFRQLLPSHVPLSKKRSGEKRNTVAMEIKIK